MVAEYEFVYDKKECANEGDMRGKKRIARVEEIAEVYRNAQTKGAVAVKIPMKDEKERSNAHTFRYRLTSAADALGLKVKVSIRLEEELAMVSFIEDKRKIEDET